MVKPIKRKGRIIGYGVFHGSPRKAGSKTDKPKGALIKAYFGARARTKAEKMHRAIQISKARAAGHRIPQKRKQ